MLSTIVRQETQSLAIRLSLQPSRLDPLRKMERRFVAFEPVTQGADRTLTATDAEIRRCRRRDVSNEPSHLVAGSSGCIGVCG